MRVSSGKTRHKAKKRLFKAAKGNFGGRSKLYRTAKETVLRAGVYAFRDRRVKKREFRALWITRLTAACRERGIRYSTFIHGLKLAGIELNRKSLSELAIHNPPVFDEIVAVVRSVTGHVAQKQSNG
ncbi:MAG: 50S ribosomal protein L20 [Planctomycetaceae bacterium]|nr:50S ribosomal protein L20 [Planctomycetaceae bacterium]